MYGIIEGTMLDDKNNEIDHELLNAFLEESFMVLEGLKILMENFKSPTDNLCFEQFGQQVDRIMGAAYTLSLGDLGDLAKLGKELGYKSSQVKEIGKLLAIQSLLSQLIKSIEVILNGYKKNQKPVLEEISLLLNRLTVASNQLGDLRISVKV